ncbi:MAG: hypothetical protein R6U87_01165, partial [Thiohalospira sp.]
EPFLINGFHEKCLHLCHANTDAALRVSIELDIGGGNWQVYKDITTANGYACHVFPAGLTAHWVRLVPHETTTATAQFFYT